MERRIVDLEVRYTHLERQVLELSDVLFEHQRLIDALRKEVVRLRGLLGDSEKTTQSEKPPHY